MKISIVRYGMGNVGSVEKAIKKLGHRPIVSSDKDEIENTDFIILPGVGSFQKGMENLAKMNLLPLFRSLVHQQNKPFLGICLGMQLLAEMGTEPVDTEGIGLVPGKVVKIETDAHLRIPHLGWNNIKTNGDDLLSEFDGCDFYFIHSYHFTPSSKEFVTSTTDYGVDVVSSVQNGHVYGTQFHPEKSQEVGLDLLSKIINTYA